MGSRLFSPLPLLLLPQISLLLMKYHYYYLIYIIARSLGYIVYVGSFISKHLRLIKLSSYFLNAG
jgi:hypothetical protein